MFTVLGSSQIVLVGFPFDLSYINHLLMFDVGVEDVNGTMHIIIARSLEMNPIIVNIMNVVPHMEKPLSLMNTLK